MISWLALWPAVCLAIAQACRSHLAHGPCIQISAKQCQENMGEGRGIWLMNLL